MPKGCLPASDLLKKAFKPLRSPAIVGDLCLVLCVRSLLVMPGFALLIQCSEVISLLYVF